MPNPQVRPLAAGSHSNHSRYDDVQYGIWQSVKADLHSYVSVKLLIRMTPPTHIPFLSHSLPTFSFSTTTSKANKSVWQKTFLQREAVVKELRQELRLLGLETRKRKRMRQGHKEATERKRDEIFF